MSKVLGKRVERKHEVRDEAAVQGAMAELDARIEMIQALIPLGLDAVHARLQQAVSELAGRRYQRGPADRRYYRWGSERGSVYLADQKVAVRVPRVRDRHAEREVRLEAYERLRTPRDGDAQLLGRVLRGIGCRNYEETAALVPEVFGLSASSVSRRFKRASAAKLQALMERDLSGHDLVALFMDGKSFGEDEMVIAIGVTLAGAKVVLGRVQTASEARMVGVIAPRRPAAFVTFAPIAPNPVSSNARVRFTLSAVQPVSLVIYDIQGRRKETLLDHELQASGEHELEVRCHCWPAGCYLYRLESGGLTATRKMLVVK